MHVGMQVAEQRPGPAPGQQPGPVRDVGVEHGLDPLPVRCDEPLVAARELIGDLSQRSGRIREQVLGGVRPLLILEHPVEAPAYRVGGGRPETSQFLADAGPLPGRRRDHELREPIQPVHDQRPRPGQPQRGLVEPVPRPVQPWPVHPGPRRVAQQQHRAHGFSQRRPREPRPRQIRHTKLKQVSHLAKL
jgi:hypothetical protein